MKTIGYYTLAILALGGCVQPAATFPFEKLEGKWTALIDGDTLVEEWVKNNGMLMGRDFYYQNGLSKLAETIRLTFENDLPVYHVSVPDENDGQELPFTCVAQTTTNIDFENRGHDFPQVIRYNLIGNDSMIATVGIFPLEADADALVFRFSKQKN